MLKDNNRLFYYVYKITNTINGKIYIGVHKTDNLEDSYMGSGTLIKRSIKKHGVENFIKEYIQFFDDYQSCLDLEELLVTEAFIASPHNYNIKGGGFGGVPSIENRQKSSDRMIKYWEDNRENLLENWKVSGRNKDISDRMKGVKKTSEHMDKINKNPEKIRKTAEKHTGMKRTEETKKNQSTAKYKTISEKGTEWLGKGQKYITNTNTNELVRVSHDYELKDGEVFGNVFAGKSIKGNKWYHNPETRDIKCFPENSQPEGFLIGRGSST